MSCWIFLDAYPEQSETDSFWVLNVTIVNDKFDYAPYIPDNTGKYISKNVGESIIKAFYILERPSTTPSVSPVPSEFPSMSSNPSVSDAPAFLHSVAPSVSPSTIPSMYPS